MSGPDGDPNGDYDSDYSCSSGSGEPGGEIPTKRRRRPVRRACWISQCHKPPRDQPIVSCCFVLAITYVSFQIDRWPSAHPPPDMLDVWSPFGGTDVEMFAKQTEKSSETFFIIALTSRCTAMHFVPIIRRFELSGANGFDAYLGGSTRFPGRENRAT